MANAELTLRATVVVRANLTGPTISARGSQRLAAFLSERQPAPGLGHHSGRGSQCASKLYVQRLEDHQIVISMSRKGNPYPMTTTSLRVSLKRSRGRGPAADIFWRLFIMASGGNGEFRGGAGWRCGRMATCPFFAGLP